MKLAITIFCLYPFFLFSQIDSIPARTYIEGNNIKALINANGLLFYDGEKGQFLPKQIDGSPIKSAGIWIGGFDLGGNLKVSVQDGERQDFRPGMASSAPGNWNQIWKVTREDNFAHIADFQKDRIVNDTLPSIFGWPAKGNVFFKKYNGFDLPEDFYFLAGYFDKNLDFKYWPDEGDYPIVNINGICFRDVDNTPDEITWNTFHDNFERNDPDASPINITIQNSVFAFNCIDNPIGANTVFVRYLLINNAAEDIDSCYVGIYTDFELGCPEDDYIGTIPEKNIIYAYNSDDFDEDCGAHKGLGEHPPAVAIKMFRGPLDEYRNVVPLASILSIIDDADQAGMKPPQSSQEYYNYLSGTWKDGIPLTFGGDGYNPTSTNLTKFIYTGTPYDSTSWTEQNAGNPPGRRKIIASFGPFRLKPEAINEIIVGYTFFPNRLYTFKERFYEINLTYEKAMKFLDNCEGTSPFFGCTSDVQFPQAPSPPPIETKNFLLFPNPAKNQVNIQFSDTDKWGSFEIYDALGRPYFKTEDIATRLYVDVSNWPSGLYFCAAWNGAVYTTQTLSVIRN